MIKKILCLVCAVLLMLSLISCKKDKEETEETSDTAIETEADVGDTAAAQEETVDSNVDPDGYDTPIDRF